MLNRRTVVAAFWALCVFATPARAESIRADLEQLRTTDLRVATIGHRLFVQNTLRCPLRMPATGLLLHSLAQYSVLARPIVIEMVAVPSPVSVLALVEESAAHSAGVQPGDGIVAINGSSLTGMIGHVAFPSQWRDQLETEVTLLPPAAPISLRVQRGATQLDLTLSPSPACRTRLEVVAGDGVIARSDGKVIQVGQSFAEQIGDEGIAVALAHELAHTILRHRAQLETLDAAHPTVAIRRERAALARRAEDEADLLSLYLLAAAGWDPAIAPRFVRTQGRRFDPIIAGNKPHRSAAQRAARMELEIRRTGGISRTCKQPATAGDFSCL